ncbi:MAG: DUF2975 domain-containing protein [Mucilaginibacter sp.]|uniref:DUF2975 domain-containing protein n=1 Tax=Mucilaginibacter sp. TaxID=1882438 RepID=UPI003263BC7E
MKIKLNTNIVINSLTIAFAVLMSLYFIIIINHIDVGFLNKGGSDIYSAPDNLKPIDPSPPSDMPYYKYIAFRDSVKQMRDLKDGNMPQVGGGQFGYLLGTGGSYKLCDTCTLKRFWSYTNRNGIDNVVYYLKLPGWKLKDAKLDYFRDDSVKYYMEHNQAHLRKIIVDSNTKDKEGNTHHNMHITDIPVKFRYIKGDQCIAIPVSRATKNAMDFIIMIPGILTVLYALYLIALFLKLMMDLSKGLAFTAHNLSTLKLIAISLITYPLVSIVIIYSQRLIFYRYFTSDIVLNRDVWDSWKIIGIGFVFLLLFRAFHQGKILKEEQDLTV